MALVNVNLSELKSLKREGKVQEGAPVAPITTMFMPVKTDGNHVLEIMTRQKFLTNCIGLWRRWHMYRAFSISLALATLYLLTVSAWLAAAAGIGAGHFYAQYYREDFIINNPFKKRDLYEVG